MTKAGVIVLAIAVLLLTVTSASYGALNATAPAAQVAAPEPAGDIARGQAIFREATFRGTPACSTCHSVEPGVTVVGPSLAGIGTRARALLTSPKYHGLASTPEQILREAILTRRSSLWGGSRHLILPEWEGVLDQQQLIDLTTFLASLQ